MHYDALLFGLFGGLIFLSRGETVARKQAVSSVISSALIAGVGAPLIASLLAAMHAGLAAVDPETMRRASALLIGSGWQVAIPAAIKAFKKWLLRDN